MALLKAVSLIGAEVVISNKTKDKLVHLVIHPDNGKILGGVGKTESFFIENIKKQDKFPIISARSLDQEEKEEFLTSLSRKLFVLRAKVETESAHYLGKVIDFEFDDISWQVERIFISDKVLFRALATELQIPRDDILSISKDQIVVRDGLVKRGAVATAEGESEYVSVGTGATLLRK